jgi:hypothetical protein
MLTCKKRNGRAAEDVRSKGNQKFTQNASRQHFRIRRKEQEED